MGGRQMEEFRAVARKVEGRWWCELRLPLGTWRIETAEGQNVEILSGEPRATLQWKVAPDRWSQQDRPFYFDLIGENNLRLSFSVRYPSSLPGGELTLNVFRILSGKS
jgi:hypothetical protein